MPYIFVNASYVLNWVDISTNLINVPNTVQQMQLPHHFSVKIRSLQLFHLFTTEPLDLNFYKMFTILLYHIAYNLYISLYLNPFKIKFTIPFSLSGVLSLIALPLFVNKGKQCMTSYYDIIWWHHVVEYDVINMLAKF